MEQNLTIVLAVGMSIVALCYRYFKYDFNFWRRLGIPGEVPLPFVNDFYNLLLRDQYKIDKERANKFGKIYGIFINGMPRIVVADPEIIRQICIKEFDVFPNHGVPPFTNKYQREFLIWLQEDRWWRVRSMMSPTFTSGKIKRMFRFLEACADDMVASIGEQIDKAGQDQIVLNSKDTFSMFTMDGITTCCYGIKLERERGDISVKSLATRNDFVRAAVKILRFNVKRVILSAIIPEWLNSFLGIEISPLHEFEPIVNRVRHLIENRKQMSNRNDDLLQLLIDARSGDKMELNETDEAESHHTQLATDAGDEETLLVEQATGVDSRTKGQLSEWNGSFDKRKRLSDSEILAEAVFLLAAGFETTSNLMVTSTYALAHHPEVQQRLYEEIRSIVDNQTKDKFEYESLTSSQYLDAVISESLRILAPLDYTDREPLRDYFIEKYNITIPKGFSVFLAIRSVQTDPDYWEEPQKFKPERFLPDERKKIVPGSYMPFSMGPKHCLGMRFGLTDAKIGLAKTVLNYELAPVPGTAFPPELRPSIGLIAVKKPLIQVRRRTQ